jgi:hypothetical protein
VSVGVKQHVPNRKKRKDDVKGSKMSANRHSLICKETQERQVSVMFLELSPKRDLEGKNSQLTPSNRGVTVNISS